MATVVGITVTNLANNHYNGNTDYSGKDAIVLYNDVKEIPEDAFSGCIVNSSRVYYMGYLEEWCTINFKNLYSNPLSIGGNKKKNLRFGYKSGDAGNKTVEELDNLDNIVKVIDLNFPEEITKILPHSFCNLNWNGSDLSSITIHDNITSIGLDAFYSYPEELNSKKIELHITDLEAWCNIDFEFPSEQDLLSLYFLDGAAGDINYVRDENGNFIEYEYCDNIPSVDGTGSNPLLITDQLFLNEQPLTNIEIPGSITKIKALTFSNYSKLTNITFHNNIEEIGKGAFYRCTGIKEITLPESLKNIKDYAFSGCTFLSIELPHNVSSIGEFAFSNCWDLSKITFSENLKYISGNAFRQCKSLKNISLPRNFEDFNYHYNPVTSEWYDPAFTYCFLETIEFNCKTVKDWVFITGGFSKADGKDVTEDSITLKTIIIKDTVENFYLNLGKYPNLEKVKLESLNSWLKINFSPRPSAEKVYLGDKKLIDITSLEIPEGISTIKKNIFKEFTGLTSLILPNNPCVIEKSAFEGCTGLTKIELNGNIHINQGAFEGCTNLTSIYSTKDTWFNQQFKNLQESPFTEILPSDEVIPKLYLDNKVVEKLTLPNDVLEINNYCFANYLGLTEITLSKNTYKIGAGAFYGCKNLTTIYIPIDSNLKFIGKDAFYGCDNLANIIIVEESPTGSTTTPSPNNYYSGKGLKLWLSIDFENKFSNPLSTINDKVILETTSSGSITKITVPESITEIKNYSFSNYNNLEVVNFHNNITNLGIGAFEGTGIKNIIIPSKITTINKSVFKNCKSLGISFDSNNISRIESEAFYGCSGLATGASGLNIGEVLKNVEYLGSNAFYGCGINIENLTLNNLNKLYSGCLNGITITNIDFSENEYIKELPEKMFYGNKTLSTIKFPKKLSIIGNSSFYGCTGLIGTLTFPNTLKEIRSEAFYGCSKLGGITLSSKINVGKKTFENCTSLSLISENFNFINTFGDSAFYNTGWYNNQPNGIISINDILVKYKGTCPEEIDLSGKTFYNIGKEAFKGQTSLKSVILSDNIRVIEESAFEECTSLENIELYNLNRIGDRAFYGCSSLENAKLTYKEAEKTGVVFTDGTYETKLKSRKEVSDIGLYAFANCTSLIYLGIYTEYEEDGKISSSYNKSDSWDFPKNIEELSPGTFENCAKLVIYGNTGNEDYEKKLKKIGYKAFKGCNLSNISELFKITPHLEYIGSEVLSTITVTRNTEYIFISEKIKSIGSNFFSVKSIGSDLSVKLNFENSKIIPRIDTNAFTNLPKNFSIIVPKSLFYDWKSYPGWKDYKNYIIAYDGGYDENGKPTTLPSTKPDRESFKYTIRKTDYTNNSELNDSNRENNLEVYEELKEFFDKSTRYFSTNVDNGSSYYGVYIYKLSPAEKIGVEYLSSSGTIKTWIHTSYLVFWSKDFQEGPTQAPTTVIGMNEKRGIQLIPLPSDLPIDSYGNPEINTLTLVGIDDTNGYYEGGDLVTKIAYLNNGWG